MKKKYGLVIYHKNVTNYPDIWVGQFVDSILGQTDQVFDIYEYNYGNDDTPSILGEHFEGRKHYFVGEENNHADAMNFIYQKAIDDGCDIIFNTNVDDFYHKNRVKFQKMWLTRFDIVSSEYQQVINGNFGRVGRISEYPIHKVFEGLNVVSNPSHCMHKRVFEKVKFDGSLIPYEDLEYWKDCLVEGFTIHVMKDILHYYRVYSNQVGKTVK